MKAPSPAAASSTPPDYKALLAEAIGIPADQAKAMSDDDQVAAHAAHMKLVNDMDDGGDDLGNADLPPGPKEIEAANAKLREAEAALTNERQARTGELLAAALADGRVKPADKARWEGEFASDFEAARVKLANTRRVLKTTPATAGLGRPNGEVLANETARRERVQALVREQEKRGLSYNDAFAAVQRDNPDLFAAMTQPKSNA